MTPDATNEFVNYISTGILLIAAFAFFFPFHFIALIALTAWIGWSVRGIGRTACACPVCGSTNLIEIRGKLQCADCKNILETCCEGGRQ